MKLYTHSKHTHEPRNANELQRFELAAAGINTKIAVAITKAFGSIWAFYVLIAWMLIWMALSGAGFWLFAKDPYPYQFLLFLSNLVQLWALPVIAVGQHVLGRKQELHSDEAYTATMSMLHEMGEIAKHLDAQDQAILHILELLQVSSQEQISLLQKLVRESG